MMDPASQRLLACMRFMSVIIKKNYQQCVTSMCDVKDHHQLIKEIIFFF